MVSAELDLDAYFQRIGYDGDRAPTLSTLEAIHYRHAVSIPFENLSPLLKWPVPIDPASLERKLIREGRGGYCYEHNLLLKSVLERLGFSVTGLSACVVWNLPEGERTARTHCLLRVDLKEGPYLADVGFGGQTLTGPLRLEADVEQATPHEPFRLVRDGREFVMQSLVREEWRSLYRFPNEEQRVVDYEVGNWYVSTHPASIFVNGLMAARPAQDRRYALINNSLAVHHRNGPSERRSLETAAELRDVLTSLFGVTLPDTPDLEPLLERLIATAR